MLLKAHHQKFYAELVNDDLFYIKYKDDSVLTKDDFESSYNCFLELAQGRPLKSLIEVGKHTSIDNKVESCNPKGLRSRAKAIVTDNLSIRLAVNQNLYEVHNPQKTKVFRKKDDALAWLDSVQ